MVVNASPQYQKAEFAYIIAKTTEAKIIALKKMLELCPKHKSSERMLADLKRRLSRLKEELVREKEIGKRKGHSGFSVKKEGDAQVVMLGLTNAGKSSLLAKLTNATPRIADYQFTTFKPEIGTLNMQCKIQVVDTPSVAGNENDKQILSIASSADLVLFIVTNAQELKELLKICADRLLPEKKLIIVNKSELLTEKGKDELRKAVGSRNLNFISLMNNDGLTELKQKIFDNLNIIRVFTKEPGKNKTEEPMVLKKGASIRNAADAIRRDYAARFLFARIWGLSARFPGQKVGIEHILHDRDIIEMHLK